jgi:hypothetical protein
MDSELITKILDEYPYPVTVEVVRLNTEEFRAPGFARLQKIFDVTESVIHFLSLICISDLVEKCMSKQLQITEGFRKNFEKNFTRPSMGTWAELLREAIKVFRVNNEPMFIEELSDYYFVNKCDASPVQKAIDSIISLRNDEVHPSKQYTPQEFKDLCNKADKLLDLILENMSFLTKYRFLHVNRVTVKYHRWSDPEYEVDFSRIKGYNPDIFGLYGMKRKTTEPFHTPALIIDKEGSREYLNLEPLIILSDEGEGRVFDIFMYLGWDVDKKSCIYKPLYNGGSFDLYNTKLDHLLPTEIYMIFKFFSASEDLLKYTTWVKEQQL